VLARVAGKGAGKALAQKWLVDDSRRHFLILRPAPACDRWVRPC